ncbi:MAG: hypothetical protein JEZ11_13250 [Desulfobacterales bacterium]|nr:hypothetical protein [Desulfobacterales bacterium]
MKRLTIVAMALCLALALTVPAMALDADFSGEFRVRGFSHSNPAIGEGANYGLQSDLSTYDDDNTKVSASDAFFDTRTRIKAVFKISDNISFTTQLDALERKWGTDTVNSGDDKTNVDFQHAYATIKTPVGGLLVGRLIGSQWGPSGMGDSNSGGKDRVLLFVPIENWTFVAYAEKYKENDTGTTTADDDLDKYTALAKYKGENFEAGFLLTHYNYQNIPAMRDMLAFKNKIETYKTTKDAATTAGGTYAASYGTLLSYLDDQTQTVTIPGVGTAPINWALTNLNLFTALPAVGAGSVGAGNLIQTDRVAIINAARDAGSAADPVLDLDNDGGFLSSDAEITATFLNGFTLPDPANATLHDLYLSSSTASADYALAGAAVKEVPVYTEAQVYIANPYIKADFGPFSVFGEFLYGSGEGDVKQAGRDAMDLEMMAYNAEGKYDFGPGFVRGGYYFQSGDNNTDDNDLNAVGYIERSEDLNIAFLLTGSGEYANAGLENALGSLGNFAGNALDPTGAMTGTTAMAGAKMIYAGIGFSPMENLDLEFVYANAKVDAAPGTKYYNIATGANYTTNWDDEVGSEYDFKATWTPMENLEYKFVAAFLKVGDYWKMGNAANKIDDNLTLFNSLTISF